ncbi:MAG: hypothetical protein ACR2QM_14090 [Longimicrobiales bacterium]
MKPKVVLLGPQRYERSVAKVAGELFPKGRVATVTAGWQEWEGDDDALDRDLGGRSKNLSLHSRGRACFEADPDLRAAHRALQSNIRLLMRAYRRRLESAHQAWSAVDRLEGRDEILGPEREAAFQAIRELDRLHVDRVAELRAEYQERLAPLHRPAVARHRREIAELMDGCSALVIEGGHVAVLLNRLRLFEVVELLGERPLVACSGGAMVLARRVVLFHDAPPQGFSRPEVAESGLGLFDGLVALPDASRRLILEDQDRVRRFARRFAPDSCVTLDGGARVDWDGRGWTPRGARRLTVAGSADAWERAS